MLGQGYVNGYKGSPGHPMVHGPTAPLPTGNGMQRDAGIANGHHLQTGHSPLPPPNGHFPNGANGSGSAGSAFHAPPPQTPPNAQNYGLMGGPRGYPYNPGHASQAMGHGAVGYTPSGNGSHSLDQGGVGYTVPQPPPPNNPDWRSTCPGNGFRLRVTCDVEGEMIQPGHDPNSGYSNTHNHSQNGSGIPTSATYHVQMHHAPIFTAQQTASLNQQGPPNVDPSSHGSTTQPNALLPVPCYGDVPTTYHGDSMNQPLPSGQSAFLASPFQMPTPNSMNLHDLVRSLPAADDSQGLKSSKRTIFTPFEVQLMEKVYSIWTHPNKSQTETLSKFLKKTRPSIKIFFQNRRSNMKNGKKRARGSPENWIPPAEYKSFVDNLLSVLKSQAEEAPAKGNTKKKRKQPAKEREPKVKNNDPHLDDDHQVPAKKHSSSSSSPDLSCASNGSSTNLAMVNGESQMVTEKDSSSSSSNSNSEPISVSNELVTMKGPPMEVTGNTETSTEVTVVEKIMKTDSPPLAQIDVSTETMEAEPGVKLAGQPENAPDKVIESVAGEQPEAGMDADDEASTDEEEEDDDDDWETYDESDDDDDDDPDDDDDDTDDDEAATDDDSDDDSDDDDSSSESDSDEDTSSESGSDDDTSSDDNSDDDSTSEDDSNGDTNGESDSDDSTSEDDDSDSEDSEDEDEDSSDAETSSEDSSFSTEDEITQHYSRFESVPLASLNLRTGRWRDIRDEWALANGELFYLHPPLSEDEKQQSQQDPPCGVHGDSKMSQNHQMQNEYRPSNASGDPGNNGHHSGPAAGSLTYQGMTNGRDFHNEYHPPNLHDGNFPPGGTGYASGLAYTTPSNGVPNVSSALHGHHLQNGHRLPNPHGHSPGVNGHGSRPANSGPPNGISFGSGMIQEHRLQSGYHSSNAHGHILREEDDYGSRSANHIPPNGVLCDPAGIIHEHKLPNGHRPPQSNGKFTPEASVHGCRPPYQAPPQRQQHPSDYGSIQGLRGNSSNSSPCGRGSHAMDPGAVGFTPPGHGSLTLDQRTVGCTHPLHHEAQNPEQNTLGYAPQNDQGSQNPDQCALGYVSHHDHGSRQSHDHGAMGFGPPLPPPINPDSNTDDEQ